MSSRESERNEWDDPSLGITPLRHPLAGKLGRAWPLFSLFVALDLIPHLGIPVLPCALIWLVCHIPALARVLTDVRYDRACVDAARRDLDPLLARALSFDRAMSDGRSGPEFQVICGELGTELRTAASYLDECSRHFAIRRADEAEVRRDRRPLLAASANCANFANLVRRLCVEIAVACRRAEPPPGCEGTLTALIDTVVRIEQQASEAHIAAWSSWSNHMIHFRRSPELEARIEAALAPPAGTSRPDHEARNRADERSSGPSSPATTMQDLD